MPAPAGNDSAEIYEAMKIFHTALRPPEATEETIFAGKVDLEKLSFIQKLMWKKLNGPAGDFRDWDTIATWARELPRKMGGTLSVERPDTTPCKTGPDVF